MVRKIIPVLCVMVVLGLAIFGAVAGVGAGKGDGPQTPGKDRRGEETIQVAPHVIARNEIVEYLHVHTNLPFSQVGSDTNNTTLSCEISNCTISNVHPFYVFADNRGNLVAKFHMDDIRDGIDAGYAIFRLDVVLTDGSPFYVGIDTVRVDVD